MLDKTQSIVVAQRIGYSDNASFIRRRRRRIDGSASLLALTVLALTVAASPAFAGFPPITGTCGCSAAAPDPVRCLSLHDCTVPRYMCDTKLTPQSNADHGTRANNRVDCTLNFPLKPGPHYMWDGDGGLMMWNNGGTAAPILLTPTSVKINYGTRRTLYGYPMTMAFSVPGNDGHNHSGWILDSVINEDMSWMPSETPATPSSPNWSVHQIHAATNRSYYLTSDGATPLKVTTNCQAGGENATDYFDKNGGYVDQVYNTPGWKASSPTMDVVKIGDYFFRDAAIVHVAVPMYDCRFVNAIDVHKSLWFVYGTLGGVKPMRFGWMAWPVIQ